MTVELNHILSQELIKGGMPPDLKTAWYDKLANRITLDELTHICYNWAYYHCLNEYRPTLLPTMPDELSHYYQLPENERWNLSKSAQDKIKTIMQEYEHKASPIKSNNQGKYLYLCEMKTYYDSIGDTEKSFRVNEIINEYRIGGLAK